MLAIGTRPIGPRTLKIEIDLALRDLRMRL